MAGSGNNSAFRVAVTNHEPVWLDLDGTVDKTCKIIEEAAGKGARLVAFPECWVPGYPAWIWSRPVDFELSVRYVQNSLRVDSPQMKKICDAAAKSKIAVSLGFSEREPHGDSVYIAQALIDDQGVLRMTRRKMKPTHMERTVFGDATGDCLASVVELNGAAAGMGEGDAEQNLQSGKKGGIRIGGLSCWEHIQPLLKYYTFSQNEQVHVAAWPPLDGFMDGSPGLWSMSIEGCRNLSQTYAVEAQAFVLHATSALTEAGIESMKTAGGPIMGHTIVASSAIIGPDGRLLSAAESKNEQLIVADLDLSLVTKTKTFADASGHYSRPDVLWLGADPGVKPVVRISKKTGSD